MNADELLAVDPESHLLTRTQGHRAQTCGDDSFVRYTLPHQRRIATLGSTDRSAIHHGSPAVPGEGIASGQKVRIGEIQRRRDDTADVDVRTATEQHAIGIEQEHLPVRGEIAQDDRWVSTYDSIQRDRLRGGLLENDGFGRANVKALPIDREARARLLDRGDGTGLVDLAAARGNFRPDRTGMNAGGGSANHDPEHGPRDGTQGKAPAASSLLVLRYDAVRIHVALPSLTLR